MCLQCAYRKLLPWDSLELGRRMKNNWLIIIMLIEFLLWGLPSRDEALWQTQTRSMKGTEVEWGALDGPPEIALLT